MASKNRAEIGQNSSDVLEDSMHYEQTLDCESDAPVTELLAKYPAFSGEIQRLIADTAALYQRWLKLGRKIQDGAAYVM